MQTYCEVLLYFEYRRFLTFSLLKTHLADRSLELYYKISLSYNQF